MPWFMTSVFLANRTELLCRLDSVRGKLALYWPTPILNCALEGYSCNKWYWEGRTIRTPLMGKAIFHVVQQLDTNVYQEGMIETLIPFVTP